MWRVKLAVMLVLVSTLAVSAGNKQKGATVLKDLQPAGTTDKDNKNQIYDFMFTTGGNEYVCRTNRDTKMKATDFIVGDQLQFQLDNDEGKLKGSGGKEVKCKIVRVQKA